MTQVANLLAAGKWMVIVYDGLNRLYRTGLLTDANSAATERSAAATHTNYPSTASNFELLTETYYNDYGWTTGTGLPSVITTTNLANSNYFITSYNASPVYAQQLTATNNTMGQVTGTKVKVLGSTNTYLYSVIFYDEMGRPIQAQSINNSGGKDIISTQYDFTGKPLRTLLEHTKAGTNAQTHTILTKSSYDHMGRLLTITKTISSVVNSVAVTAAEETIVQNSYDELGQLKTKKLAPAYNSSAGLESLTYDYNIRGWLLGMNRAYAKDGNNTNKFGFDLGYDQANNGIIGGQTYANPQYNGNVEGMVWKSAGDGEKRKYDFKYDNANRLLAADFNQYTGGTFNKTANVDFSVKMGDGSDYTTAYDANGNIKQMQQWGLKINSSSLIDNLTYNYTANSNKLLNVIDAANDASTKLGDFRASTLYQSIVPTKATNTVDYTYDANGNLKKDLNKDIGDASTDGIVYNHLNLPILITVKKDATHNKGTITYTYDASGNKLQKQTIDIGTTGKTITTTTSYINGFVYESKTTVPVDANNPDYTDVLQFFGHEEGRVRFKPAIGATPASFAFDYFIKDHLGNVRMVLTEEQQQDHYPTATLEGSGAGSPVENEKAYYDINNAYVQNPPASLSTDYINDNGTNNLNTFGNRNGYSAKMYKLNAATNRTGLGMVLKVMAGDKINVLGKSYYRYSSGTVSNTLFDASALIAAFLGVGGTSNVAASHGATSTLLNANTAGTVTPVNLFTNGNPVNSNNNVKAGIAYILFDEQFKYAGGGFDAVDASSAGALKSHVLPDINVPKNGYIYIYCSNESNIDVFFDNLEVIDKRSSILEETHYYPFGLTMAGISSKAANQLENKFKFNGKEFNHQEFSDGSGLEMYDFGARLQDPQIGRWFTIDPHAENSRRWSPYNYAYDNPVRFIDPDGMDGEDFGDVTENMPVTLGSVSEDRNYTTGDGDSQYDQNGKTLTASEARNANANGGNTGQVIVHGKVIANPRPTTYEAAQMSKAVYGDKVYLKGGWQNSSLHIQNVLDTKNDGFLGRLFEKVVDGTAIGYVYAFAGTQDIRLDGLQDLLQLEGVSSQYDQAAINGVALSNALGGTVSFTGHSLGGGLAALAALVTGRSAITFNAASLSDQTLKDYGVYGASDRNIAAFAERFDPLTLQQDYNPMLNSSQGVRQTISTGVISFNPFVYHSINTVLFDLH